MRNRNPRRDNQSIADYYFEIENGHLAKSENEIIVASNKALSRCMAAGVCEFEATKNNSGVLHTYTFMEKDAPTFPVKTRDASIIVEIKIK